MFENFMSNPTYNIIIIIVRSNLGYRGSKKYVIDTLKNLGFNLNIRKRSYHTTLRDVVFRYGTTAYCTVMYSRQFGSGVCVWDTTHTPETSTIDKNKTSYSYSLLGTNIVSQLN